MKRTFYKVLESKKNYANMTAYIYISKKQIKILFLFSFFLNLTRKILHLLKKFL